MERSYSEETLVLADNGVADLADFQEDEQDGPADSSSDHRPPSTPPTMEEEAGAADTSDDQAPRRPHHLEWPANAELMGDILVERLGLEGDQAAEYRVEFMRRLARIAPGLPDQSSWWVADRLDQ